MENQYFTNFKLKKLIKKLNTFQGTGTCMVSLQITSDKKISEVVQRLTVECNSVANIKSTKNSKLILSAIGSIKDRLKYYNHVPTNGLQIFCGIDNIDKKLLLDFEPPKPIISYKYHCDSKFDTEELENMLSDDKTYGYIVIDGSNLICAKMKGTNYDIVHKLQINPQRKHNKGGQSSVRFERLYLEKKLLYIRKCISIINNVFLSNDKVNVELIILSGISNIKNQLYDDITLDQRVKNKINKNLLDIGSSGEQGLRQTIELSSDIIKNNSYLYEKEILSLFYNDISIDAKNICNGIKETLYYFENNLLEKIIIYEKNEYIYKDGLTFIDYLIENKYTDTIKIIILECNTMEGQMFVKGFGGVCGYTRYNIYDDNKYNDFL